MPIRPRRLLEVLGWMTSLVLLLWFIAYTVRHSTALTLISWDFYLLVALLLISLLYVLNQLASATVWWLLLKGVGSIDPGLKSAVSICLLSQAGKYLPGNVGQHVGRLVLSRRAGLRVAHVGYTMFIETMWVMAVSGSLGLLFFWVESGSESTRLLGGWGILVFVLLTVTAAFSPHLFRPTFTKLVSRYLAKKGSAPSLQIEVPGYAISLASVLVYLFSYLLMGLVIALIAFVFFAQPVTDVALLGCAFSVAWIAGFVTPGSPAGLGVREFFLVALLTPFYGVDVATGVTAFLRIVTLSGDGLAYLLGLALLKPGLGRSDSAR